MGGEDKNLVNEPKEEWGGQWTIKKLDAFAKYVWSYLTIMNKNPYWKTIYFDGFAGSGHCKKDNKTDIYKQLQITLEEECVYKGAAERVLNLENNLSFEYYYFIDTNNSSLKKLENTLVSKFPNKKEKLIFKAGDCNQWIKELAKALKSKRFAALVFLDPFGMQIDWNSIVSLKGTRADIWILVPTGVIINRLLDKNGKLKHIEKLQSFFGLDKEEITKEFYKFSNQQTLFGEQEIIKKVPEPIEQIARVYVKQLKTIWKYVTEKPLRLENSKGVPIFHFVFASNNENAVKIAKDIIKTT